jgi:hypothetical protein
MAMSGLITGCTANDVPNVSGVEDHFVEAVVVQPVVATILVGDPITAADQATLTATLYNKAGTALTGLTFVWRSSDPTVATVDNSGVSRTGDCGDHGKRRQGREGAGRGAPEGEGHNSGLPRQPGAGEGYHTAHRDGSRL